MIRRRIVNTRYGIRITGAIVLLTASIVLSLMPESHVYAGDGTLKDVASSMDIQGEASEDVTVDITLNSNDVGYTIELDEELKKQLEEEFDQASKEFDKEVERMNREHRAKIRSVVWKIIAVVIVIAMFVVGTVTTLKQQKRQDETDNSDPML